AEGLDVLFLLEVGVDPVGQEQACLPAGNEQTERSEVVQLAERAREGGLAAVVRAGDDDHALGLLEVVAVGDDLFAVTDELVREREVERLLDGLLLGAGGDVWV